LKLEKARQLEVDWDDGTQSIYPIAYLRKFCPCAACKVDRENQKKSRLHVMSSFSEGPVTVSSAEKVGNYALKLNWSDGHASGIYSYEYLRDIAQTPSQK
jgi:DUF971 family protein